MSDPVPREINFVLPFLLPSLNVRDRQHWAVRRRQMLVLQQEIMAAMRGPEHYPRPPFSRARITVTRISTGQLDPDNLAASAKGLLDVVKMRSARNPLGLSFIVDDDPARIELSVHQQHAPSRKEQATTVRIEELLD